MQKTILIRVNLALSGRSKVAEGCITLKSILIADDSSFMRTLIKSILCRAGYVVVGEAENGIVCVEKYKELSPEIVTLDVTMDEMDGIQTLAALMEINPAVKVLMISALGQECIVRKAIAAGARAFIVKPFKKDHLVWELSRIK